MESSNDSCQGYIFQKTSRLYKLIRNIRNGSQGYIFKAEKLKEPGQYVAVKITVQEDPPNTYNPTSEERENHQKALDMNLNLEYNTMQEIRRKVPKKDRTCLIEVYDGFYGEIEAMAEFFKTLKS